MTAAPKGRIAWSDLLRDDDERAALTEAVDHEIARSTGKHAEHLRGLRAALAGERGGASWGRVIKPTKTGKPCSVRSSTRSGR